VSGRPVMPESGARPLLRLASRISVRLLAFNVLLVFLPLAGVFYLGEYEAKLQDALDRSLVRQARVVAAVLSERGELDAAEIQAILDRQDDRAGARIRVIDRQMLVVADSGAELALNEPPASEARQSLLYRIGAAIFRVPSAMFAPSDLLVQPADYYEASARLSGPEVLAALKGELGRQERTTAGGARSVTLYRTAPVFESGDVAGVVLASQSTQRILLDLYAVRLGIFRIFVISVVVSALLSLVVAATIVRPLSRLRREAGAIVDRRGRLTGTFTGSRRLDEIGDLSRALESLTRSLERHLRFIESFSADVSHEFKNPLASIRTATDMLAEVDDAKDRERFVRIIQQEVARMETLLSGIREVTLIDAELQREERMAVRVAEVVSRVVEGFRMRDAAGAGIRFDPPPDDLRVEASADRLAQVLENLLSNAVSFSPAEAAVEVEASRDREMVVLSVADRGPGVPEAHKARIFERFFSYRKGRADSGERHAGLGLSIVRSIVDGYGGSIDVRDREGGGAIFEIRLPAA
jgi:two-component system, OmpR family, sensor histidine kinase ChvG